LYISILLQPPDKEEEACTLARPAAGERDRKRCEEWAMSG